MTILKTIKMLGLVAVLAFSPVFVAKTLAQPGVTVPVESFYDELTPYGNWMQYPGYGNVWAPNVGPDFQPYATGGHWVVTEYGNTWVSDYNWGWAPFHYGRWIYDNAYGGWLWIPGTDWGPAWVAWRSGGGYYGWAPLGPGMNVSININIPAPYWTFVPQMYITSPRVYSYCVPRPNVVNIYHNTTIINNYYRSNNRAYAYGPPRGDIERITRQSVPVYRIDHMDRPGRSVVGNGSVGFYRPGNGPARQEYSRNDRYNSPYYRGSNSRGTYYGENTPGRGYNSGTGRGDVTNNAGRGDFNNGMGRGEVTNSSGRGDFNSGNPNPGWNNNRNNMSDRGTFDGRSPSDRRGSIGTPSNPNPMNNTDNTFPGQPDRIGSGRGSYQMPERVNSLPQGGGFQQQPDRSVERFGRPAPAGSNSQAFPDARGSGGFQRMQENRGTQIQRAPEGGAGQGQGGRFGREGGIQGGGRGPR
ncbi:DUF6600 domain-containing protein [Spirosoma terrae]|uniref:DUF6600 domain-containing protein n=1 Tax=Spirosoma terrae TaxID=1968276 RepID=UPI001BB04D5D|nr:DUF6600 domain-containing protein [Spirosoma terrae]